MSKPTKCKYCNTVIRAGKLYCNDTCRDMDDPTTLAGKHSLARCVSYSVAMHYFESVVGDKKLLAETEERLNEALEGKDFTGCDCPLCGAMVIATNQQDELDELLGLEDEALIKAGRTQEERRLMLDGYARGVSDIWVDEVRAALAAGSLPKAPTHMMSGTKH